MGSTINLHLLLIGITMSQYITGDLAILRDLVIRAYNEQINIASVGDSQETSPGGAGVAFTHALNTKAITTFGRMSALPIRHPGGGTGAGSDNTTYPFGSLPELNVRTGSSTGNGFLVVMNPRATSEGESNQFEPLGYVDDVRDWFRPVDLQAEIFVYNYQDSPTHVRVTHINQPSGIISYAGTVVSTQHLEIPAGIGWKKVTATGLTFDPENPFPSLIIQGSNGTGGQVGLTCGGVRFVDAGKSGGMIFQSLGDGGERVDSWMDLHNTKHEQFNAYNPWDAILIQFGANDAGNSYSVAEWKQNLQNMIDMFRNSNWNQVDVPIILTSDNRRVITGGFIDSENDLLAAYPAANAELANENDNVLAINTYQLAEDSGYDPAIDTADGVHYGVEYSLQRADELWGQFISGAINDTSGTIAAATNQILRNTEILLREVVE